MPEHVECENCGLTLMGLTVGTPEPLHFDDCPECGTSEFSET
jgi:predicted nucleic-acid-binding Zn-ribbon protein